MWKDSLFKAFQGNQWCFCCVADSSCVLEYSFFPESWQVIKNLDDIFYLHMNVFLLLNVRTWRYKCVFDLWIDTIDPLINYLWEESGRNQHLLWNYSGFFVSTLVLTEYAKAIDLLDVLSIRIVIEFILW